MLVATSIRTAPLQFFLQSHRAQNTEERVSHSFIAPETSVDMAVTSNKLDIPPQTIRPSYDYRSGFSLSVAP